LEQPFSSADARSHILFPHSARSVLFALDMQYDIAHTMRQMANKPAITYDESNQFFKGQDVRAIILILVVAFAVDYL
jgi:hypothetical protein